MFNSFLRTGLALLALIAFLSMPSHAQQPATPEDVARGFYSWYLHQLSQENTNPLKQKTTALKYLTPQLYANAPRLSRLPVWKGCAEPPAHIDGCGCSRSPSP